MISTENKIKPDDSIENLFIFQMEQFVRAYRKIATNNLKDHDAGISLDEWVVLKRISEAGGCSQTELSEFTVKGPAKMTRTLDLLQKKELVEKHQDPEDRRRYMVFVTEAGSVLIKKLMPSVKQYRQRALAGFDEKERKQLNAFLNRMIRNVS
ncbi:MAG: MarR family transcriptional regulator [Bacteroidetes bacterium]|nr:MarR family transcriptional regulator [Bacteroidota bacterium]